ncbi:MAG: UDP-N-acetylmuramoyl-L-alanine--D-glutamate ligase [Chthoniobacterales bacterium]|nr:UDP-N-acetylmuramoyl-L-alanine--D-glutamate ligase [Chthoniobacterales bacterium]
MSYEGKNILVLGLGCSGLGAARLLKKVGATVTVVDSGTSELLHQRAQALRAEGINVFLGAATEQSDLFYDLAVLSPGIEKSAPLVRNITDKGIPLLGEVELAYSLCSLPIVAITGSNGKTTTTELTTKMLQGAGVRALACGNIGLCFSEAVSKAHDYDIFVLEISSFQLETIEKFHPKIAVWLNLSPNHLDRYTSMEEYARAKLRIFKNQQAGDIAVVPKNFDRYCVPLLASCLTFSAYELGADFSFKNNQLFYHEKPLLNLQETRLRGLHNVENLMAAFAVGVALKCDLKLMVEAVKNYTPPPHRCELVATHCGITWINDSKATTLDAMEKAISAIEKTSPIILIAGGKNKGSSFESIFPLVKARVKKAIIIGERSDLILAEWPGMAASKAPSLEEAVALAAASAVAGDTILLSPGTSSYDMFTDYQERGECFKKAVHQLIL